MSGSTLTTAQLKAYATQQAAAYGVPANVFLAQIQQESGFNPNSPASSTGAIGIAQILPSTAANPGYGVAPLADPTNPEASITFAAQYDAALAAANGGNYNTALSKYSGGAYTADSLTGGAYSANAGTSAASTAAAGGSALTPVTTPTSGTGSTTGTASTGTGASSMTGLAGMIWEILTRGLVFFAGLAIVLVALIALLFRSKTVQTATRNLGAVAA